MTHGRFWPGSKVDELSQSQVPFAGYAVPILQRRFGLLRVDRFVRPKRPKSLRPFLCRRIVFKTDTTLARRLGQAAAARVEKGFRCIAIR